MRRFLIPSLAAARFDRDLTCPDVCRPRAQPRRRTRPYELHEVAEGSVTLAGLHQAASPYLAGGRNRR